MENYPLNMYFDKNSFNIFLIASTVTQINI